MKIYTAILNINKCAKLMQTKIIILQNLINISQTWEQNYQKFYPSTYQNNPRFYPNVNHNYLIYNSHFIYNN